MPTTRDINRTARWPHAYLQAAGSCAAELLWPTYCAACGAPGSVLCGQCRRSLAYIDWWRACPRCGAPFGRIQCTECNAVMLQAQGRVAPSFDGCVSCVLFEGAGGRIVRSWKDLGERRLVADMAALLARAIPPAWLLQRPAVSFIPASRRALGRRGFDHGQELGGALAAALGLRCEHLLDRPRTVDQRALTRRQRLANAAKRFEVLPGAPVGQPLLLVDDVMTTGATMNAACDALRATGAQAIYCCTFARVI